MEFGVDCNSSPLSSLRSVTRRSLMTMAGVTLIGSLYAMSAADADGPSRSGLPYAGGKSFDTLEAYLGHLESRGPIGVPFYKQVAPGLYERQESIRIGGQPPRRISRRDLAVKYGFEK